VRCGLVVRSRCATAALHRFLIPGDPALTIGCVKGGEAISDVEDALYSAVQLFGGPAIPSTFPVQRMMRDAKITHIYEGTNQTQRVVMSPAILR
jgi:hypothetical protein